LDGEKKKEEQEMRKNWVSKEENRKSQNNRNVQDLRNEAKGEE